MLRSMGTPSYFLPFLQRGKTLKTACLLLWRMYFPKWVFYLKKEFASKGANFNLRELTPSRERSRKEKHRVTVPEIVFIHLNPIALRITQTVCPVPYCTQNGQNSMSFTLLHSEWSNYGIYPIALRMAKTLCPFTILHSEWPKLYGLNPIALRMAKTP